MDAYPPKAAEQKFRAETLAGKFHRTNAKFNLPVYLDGEVRYFVQQIAESRRTDVSSVVNRLLRSGMKLVEAAK